MNGNLPMTASVQPRRQAGRLHTLRAGTAMAAALAFGAAAVPARADGFNGTGTVTSGSATINGADITVISGEAVIDWDAPLAAAGDANVSFLSAGQTVNFHDQGSSPSDFTVLNRVLPSFGGAPAAATISFSGAVTSTVNGGSGGNVWFYSPYGIIANGTASFNVGSLLLTTSDIQLGPNGSLYLDQANGDRIGFQQAARPGSFVRVLPGAQLNAANSSVNSAYVGIFAPRIEQGGAIRADAMAALVAGEAGTITFRQGLIDIAVAVGTTDANGIVHTGSTGGSAPLDGEPKTVAMVAVPKNTALTMLLSGSAGFDPVSAGVTETGAVVLYAGDTAQAGAAAPDGTRLSLTTPGNERLGHIGIGNTVFTGPLAAFATGDISVSPLYGGVNSPGLADFRGTTLLTAGRSISLAADAGETIRATESLFLAPLQRGIGENVTIKVAGDPAGNVPAGNIEVANLLSISAIGDHGFASATQDDGRVGQGGAVDISISRGTLSAGLDLTVDASGTGEDGLVNGGAGIGGTIDIGVSDGGTISAANLGAFADGAGGSAFPSVAPAASTGGDGAGGTVTLHDDGGLLAFAGEVRLQAQTFGGSGATTAGGASGGAVAVRIDGGAQTWGQLFANASVTGGGLQSTTTAVRPVIGRDDGVLLAVRGAGSLNADSVVLQNSAFISGSGAAAQAPTAGGVDVQVSGGGTLTVSGGLAAVADAGLPVDISLGGIEAGPEMRAGRVAVIADNGAIDVGALVAQADAVGIAARDTGGTARGGSATLGARNGGTIVLGSAFASRVSAEAYGAIGPAPGHAVGGTALVFADNGSITASGRLGVSASALWGGVDYGDTFSGNGFDATGGTASVDLLAGGGTLSIGDLAVYAKGEASLAIEPSGTGDLLGATPSDIVGLDGNGGTGAGGTARLNVAAGTLTTNQLALVAYGLGGGSGAGIDTRWQSGAGQGGSALLNQSGGTVNAGYAVLSAEGIGGTFDSFANSGFQASNGGGAAGGTARAVLSGGTFSSADGLILTAGAMGGAGMETGDGTAGGNGGAANNAAGLAELVMTPGSTASLVSPNVQVVAAALGGAGGASSGTAGTGGGATAGTARFNLADGSISISGGASALADAAGGSGRLGGNATGGSAAFLLTDTVATPATTRALGSLALTADATGGAGATVEDDGTATSGSIGFTVQAGRPASALGIAGNLLARAQGTSAPAGDGFLGLFGAVPVTVGGDALISTNRDITAAILAGGGLDVAGTLDLVGRTIAVGGQGVLSAGGNVTVLAQRSISLGGLSAGGTTLLRAFDPSSGTYGAISVAGLSSAGPVTVQSGSFNGVSPGAITLADSFASAGDFKMQTVGDLTANAITVPGDLSLVSTNGTLRTQVGLSAAAVVLGGGTAVQVSGPIASQGTLTATSGGTVTATANLAAGGNTIVDAVGGITLPQLTSGGTTLLRATGGTISIGSLLSAGPITVLGRSATISSSGPLDFASASATAGSLSLTSGGNLTMATADATGAVTLTAANGAITATQLSAGGTVTAQGRSVSIGSAGSLSFGNSSASAGNFAVNAAGNLAFGSLSATGALALGAGGIATFNGAAVGASIAVSSGDIAIGNGGQLGQRGVTGSVSLINSSPAAGTRLGGAAGTSGWSLDGAEASRLFADQMISIGIAPNATNAADLVIGSFAPRFGTGSTDNIGAAGSLLISTPGDIRVTGAFAPIMASNAGLVGLTAGGHIDVVTDTGTIVLRSAGGALGGTLRMTAPTVRVATLAALASLDGGPSLLQAATRLGFNDGVVNAAGTVQANALEFNVGASTLFIQNSGLDSLPANRRGFLGNSVAINGLSAGIAPSFAINGAVAGPDGQLVTGYDTYASILVNGDPAGLGGSFNPLSSVNGCIVGLDCVGLPTSFAPPEETVDLLDGPLNAGGGADAILNVPVVQFGDQPLLDSPPLIDEPVTGVGNDDLWERQCPVERKICP